jgi:hypothetical protein
MKKVVLFSLFFCLAFSGKVSAMVYGGPLYFEGTADVSTNGIVTNFDNATNLSILNSVCRYTLYFGIIADTTHIEGQKIAASCPEGWSLSDLNNLNLENISGLPNFNGDGYYWLELYNGSFWPNNILYIEYIRQNGKWFYANAPLPQTPDPVIIIPGIVGTELYNGSDLIWPDLLQMADINDYFLTDNLNLDTNGNSM